MISQYFILSDLIQGMLRVSCIFVADGAKNGQQGEDGAPA